MEVTGNLAQRKMERIVQNDTLIEKCREGKIGCTVVVTFR